MKILIFGNGEIIDYGQIQTQINEIFKPEYIICCDGGAKHCIESGLMPDVILGDMDSIDDNHAGIYKEKGIAFETHPKEKDISDMALGLMKAIEQGASDVILAGAVGSRFDHSLSNMGLLYKCLSLGINAWIIDENSRTTLVNKSLTLKGEKDRALSLLPFSKTVTVTGTGLRESVENTELAWGATLGVYTAIAEDEASITVDEGVLTVVILRNTVGERFDQRLANMSLLCKGLSLGVNVWVKDGNNRITLIDKKLVLKGEKGRTVSFIPFSETVKGITAEGFHYPITNGELSWGDTLGVSNVCVNHQASVTVSEGWLAVVIAEGDIGEIS